MKSKPMKVGSVFGCVRCGARPYFVVMNDWTLMVQCEKCHRQVGPFKTAVEAQDKWNEANKPKVIMQSTPLGRATLRAMLLYAREEAEDARKNLKRLNGTKLSTKKNRSKADEQY